MKKKSRNADFFIAAAVLTVLVAAVFGRTLTFDFVVYDDTAYVAENDMVLRGLTPEGIAWAFTTGHASNWHPVTWLSHMLDATLFGNDPGAHHAVNVLFHLANTLLLFIFLAKSTGSPRRSAFVAALFAVHPLHVESVAWIAERKDVLSTFFMMCALLSYLGYVKRPSVASYVPVPLFLALGLMAKPMLVTLPVLLLIIDFWPLGRMRFGPRASDSHPSGAGKKTANRPLRPVRLVLEKLPLFALSAVSAVVTVIVQKSGGAVSSFGSLPVSTRLANALVSYVAYIVKTVLPLHLAVFYPHRLGGIPVWQPIAAALVLVPATVYALKYAKKLPFIAAGWLFFLVALLPVIGLVQVGSQAMADRYTYTSIIGLFVIAAWGAPLITANLRNRSTVLAVSGALVIAVFAMKAWAQVGTWRDSESLFRHAMEVTEDNWLAHNNLAAWLEDRGRYDEALEHYLETIALEPDNIEFYGPAAGVLVELGRYGEALDLCGRGLAIDPDNTVLLRTRGVVLTKTGDLDGALSAFRMSLKLDGSHAETAYNFANILVRRKEYDQAVEYYRRAIRSEPDFAEALHNLASVHVLRGELAEAIPLYEKALAINPDYTEARENLERVRRALEQ